MKFSIVIPLYNKAPYIKETLQSLVNQTKLPYELIIVDDKSTDDSLKIAKDFLKNVPLCFNEVIIKIIELEKNYGIGYARNRGFSITSGDVVSFLDADDLYADNLIKTANVLMSTYTIDFLILGIQFFPSNKILPNINKIKNKITQISSIISITPNAYCINNPLELITSEDFYMGVGSNVMLKKIHGESIKFIEERIIYEGIDYWYRVLQDVLNKANNNIGLLMGEYLQVRQVPGSASRKRYNKWNQIDYPPVLTRFKKSRYYYDKRLMSVVAKRWINHALSSLKSTNQKVVFIFKYRSVFLKQIHYFFLHKLKN